MVVQFEAVGCIGKAPGLITSALIHTGPTKVRSQHQPRQNYIHDNCLSFSKIGYGWGMDGIFLVSVHNQQPHWGFKTRATRKKQHGCETICLGKGRGVAESNGIFRDVLFLPINPPAGHSLIPITLYQTLPELTCGGSALSCVAVTSLQLHRF